MVIPYVDTDTEIGPYAHINTHDRHTGGEGGLPSLQPHPPARIAHCLKTPR